MQEHIKNVRTGVSESMLKEVNSISEDAYKLFKMEEDIDKIGSLINQNWRVKRGLTKKVTNNSFDAIYDTAIKNGALGGKLMGAGGGGFFIFWRHHRNTPKLEHRF